ncbi:MAG: hypothetical protein K2Y23_08080 [Cyanobacteria bacterium]|nr:hypothetical protein [Cyanobacteriota bacterium]
MQPLADDTPLDIEARQIEGWRRLSSTDKLALIASLSRAIRELTLAGIRARHPGASPREQFLRLAMLTLGPELARSAYPEIDRFGLT